MRTMLRGKISLLFLTIAVLLAIPAVALADVINGDADADALATPHGNSKTATQAPGGAVATYNFDAFVENTGPTSGMNANVNDVFKNPGDYVQVDIARAGDWLNTSDSGSPASFTFTQYTEDNTSTSTPDNTQSGTIKIKVPCGATGSRDMTVTLAPTAKNAGPNGIRGDADDTTLPAERQLASTLTFTYTITAGSTPDASCTPVNNAPTVSTAAANANGNEGSELTTNGAFSDADGNNTLTITKLSGAGTVTPSTTTPGEWSWSHTPNDNGSGTVVVQASDGTATVTDSFDWSAANVAPTLSALTLSGNTGTACLSGNAVKLSFSFSDPASADTHTGSINWGDGSPNTAFTSSPQTDVEHSYSAGTYTINVSVSDDDNGTDSDTGSVSKLYKMSGILSPFNTDGSSTWKYGATIPVKVQITDCNNTPVQGLAPKLGTSLANASTPAVSINEDVFSTSNADTGNVLRYSDPQYIYNFNSKSAAITDQNATYWMSVKGFNADGQVVTDPAQVNQKFGIKSK